MDFPKVDFFKAGVAGKLLGRQRECEEFDRLLLRARGGQSGVLAVSGEPGVGKSALLGYAMACASGFRIARAVGVESEMELPFAALQQLCAPMLDRLACLPSPQSGALEVAFGLSEGAAPNQFLVGLAVLSLLSETAQREPVLCVIDDAQWLDRASAESLAFVARRLLAECLVLVIGARVLDGGFSGLPELVVRGLGVPESSELLGQAVRGPLDERVREQIVAETRGNPLALLELPRGMTPAQLAGGFGLPSMASLSGQIEEKFLQRLGALPHDTQRFLLLAAAEPLGNPVLLQDAALRIGIEPSAAEPAEQAGLLELGVRVTFRHPLVRSATYRAASVSERREVHRALAEVTDPEIDPDRRAWHRAHGASQPSEEISTELERSAGRAQARGGLAAAAAFLERAAMLTPDQGRRATRSVAAAEAKQQAGAPDAALDLLAVAELGPLDELSRARSDMVRAQIAYAQNRGSEAAELLLHAGKRLEPLELALARATYLDALAAASFAGTSAAGVGVAQIAKIALAAPRPDPMLPADLLLDGVATQIVDGYGSGVPMLKQALGALRREEVSDEEQLRCSLLAYRSAVDLWDDESWYVLANRYVELARASGALPLLLFALNAQIVGDAFAGELSTGNSLLEELRAVCDIIGSAVPPYAPLALVAWKGPEADVLRLTEDTEKDALARGETLAVSAARWASAVFYNGLGHYDKALEAAEQACSHGDLGYADWSLAELILAAVRTGKEERAGGALQRLSARAHDSQSEWALGIEARCRALLSDETQAERLYGEAIERLGGTRILVELARTRLQYGEWLRRQRRKLEARKQLSTAYEMFTSMGYDVYAGCAERELLATGQRVRRPDVKIASDLTAQEAEVCRLAAEGSTNTEIAARLYISASTVDYHLRKSFRKLGIRSRAQLARRLPQ
jgi:DNA-binding NarL/FixJ family response regulator